MSAPESDKAKHHLQNYLNNFPYSKGKNKADPITWDNKKKKPNPPQPPYNPLKSNWWKKGEQNMCVRPYQESSIL